MLLPSVLNDAFKDVLLVCTVLDNPSNSPLMADVAPDDAEVIELLTPDIVSPMELLMFFRYDCIPLVSKLP